MQCHNCQTTFAKPVNFCQRCGTPLSASAQMEGAPTLLFQKTPKKLATVTEPTPGPSDVTIPAMTGDDELPPMGGTLYQAGSLGGKSTANVPSEDTDLVGQVIAGYTVVKKLGEGGMGAVYQATHPQAKPIALKVLHSEFANQPKIVERFFNEAKAVNQINQPHIVDISDFGFLANGQPYIAMEFLEGFDLAGRLQQQSPLLEAEALDITMQVLEALQATHQAQIIHRDLKPENIFLLKLKKHPGRWFVKVLDFGIAKLGESNGKTQSGTILGTPRYMSPEQARGATEIVPASDLYSLGVILYELVTGKAPFEEVSYLGYLVAHQRKVVGKDVPRAKELNPSISDDTEAIILRCLEKNPQKRFTSAKEMYDALGVSLKKLQAVGNGRTRLQTPAGIAQVKPAPKPVIAPVVKAEEPAFVEPIKPPVPPESIPVAQQAEAPARTRAGWIAMAALSFGALSTLVYLATH